MLGRSAEETHSIFRAATLRAESDRHQHSPLPNPMAGMNRSQSEIPAISTSPLGPGDFLSLFKRVGWVTTNPVEEARCYADADFENVLSDNLRIAFLAQQLREPKVLAIYFPVTRFGEIEIKREYHSEKGFTIGELLHIVFDFYQKDAFRPEEVEKIRQKWFTHELKGVTFESVGSALVPWSLEAFETVPTWNERQITTYLYALHMDNTGTFDEKWARLRKFFDSNRQEARNAVKVQQFLGPEATPVEVLPKNWPPDQIEAVLKAAGYDMEDLYTPAMCATALEEHVRAGKPVPVVNQSPEARDAKTTCLPSVLTGGLMFFEGFRIRTASPNMLSITLMLGS